MHEEKETQNPLTKIVDAPYTWGEPYNRLTHQEMERLDLRKDQAIKEEWERGKEIDVV